MRLADRSLVIHPSKVLNIFDNALHGRYLTLAPPPLPGAALEGWGRQSKYQPKKRGQPHRHPSRVGSGGGRENLF